MIRKILIATDGSAVSQHTACAGVEFAGQLGADVLALFVAPAYQYPVYVEIIPPSYPDEKEYAAQMRHKGEEAMTSIMRAADAAGLKHACMTAFSDAAALKIVDVAEQQQMRPDLHGIAWPQRLGTIVVRQRHESRCLSHTSKPVLVHRLIRSNPAPLPQGAGRPNSEKTFKDRHVC